VGRKYNHQDTSDKSHDFVPMRKSVSSILTFTHLSDIMHYEQKRKNQRIDRLAKGNICNFDGNRYIFDRMVGKPLKIYLNLAAIILVSLVVIFVNKIAFKKIDELEDL